MRIGDRDFWAHLLSSVEMTAFRNGDSVLFEVRTELKEKVSIFDHKLL
jgi:hypothetical protein